MDHWLLRLSNEDIAIAVDAIYDSEVAAELEVSRPDLREIWRNPSTQRMAEHVTRCEFDRAWAILSWSGDR